jgi:hypothetical protein
MKKLIIITFALFMLTGCAWNERVDLGAIREQITKYEADLAALRTLASQHPEVAGAVKQAEESLAAMKSNLAELEAADKNPPAWMVAGGAVVGFLSGPIGSRLLSMIPVVGGAAGPILNFLWKLGASRAMREKDKAAYAALTNKAETTNG